LKIEKKNFFRLYGISLLILYFYFSSPALNIKLFFSLSHTFILFLCGNRTRHRDGANEILCENEIHRIKVLVPFYFAVTPHHHRQRDHNQQQQHNDGIK
jgi:hypothetical protein